MAPQIASLAGTLGVTPMLVWDALPLFAMLWLLRPRGPNALPNHPLQLMIIAFCAGGPAMVVIAICRRPGSMVGLTLAFMPLYQWMGVLVAFLLRQDQVIGSVHFLTPGVRIPTKSVLADPAALLKTSLASACVSAPFRRRWLRVRREGRLAAEPGPMMLPARAARRGPIRCRTAGSTARGASSGPSAGGP